jgi:hypothetical protein
MGWVVSIPVFCDSGFVILNPIRKALVKRTAVSSVAMTVALSAGLYISHVFIPPTPGPIAAANTLGVGDNLLLVMGLGVVCSIFPLIAGLVYAKFIGKRVKSADEVTDNGEVTKTYEELVAEYGKLPNGFNALAPILVPIILMALGSISSMAGWTGDAVNPQVTIDATEMSKETADWGSYSAGKQLTDKILYNIRRERRCELISEGLRGMDLQRWRSYDQLMTTPAHMEGIHLWNTPMQSWYNNLNADGSSNANVSSSSLSEYYRPLEVNMTATNSYKDGFTWHMAHYLQPLPIKQFLLTASDYASVEKSPLYQNPYWSTSAGQSAEK